MSSSATGSAATNLLHKALLSIHSSSPRLIHTPVVPPSLTRGPAHAPKKASVAVSAFCAFAVGFHLDHNRVAVLTKFSSSTSSKKSLESSRRLRPTTPAAMPRPPARLHPGSV